jgi:hypothetical protein
MVERNVGYTVHARWLDGGSLDELRFFTLDCPVDRIRNVWFWFASPLPLSVTYTKLINPSPNQLCYHKRYPQLCG